MCTERINNRCDVEYKKEMNMNTNICDCESLSEKVKKPIERLEFGHETCNKLELEN